MRTRTVARTGALNLAAQVAILAVLYFTAHERAADATGAPRVLLLMGVTLLPSAIWALFFYLQDRRQPEPTANVVMAFAAGAGAAAALVLPAEAHLFQSSEWMYRSPLALALGATLVRGALVAAMFYVIIRYGFMPSADFDEPADGMAYGAFAGSGLAAVLSLSQASAHPDFTLFALAYAAATNVMAYASIGALTGYLVGRAKFQLRPAPLSYAEAIVAGAALTGLYHVIAEYAFVEESANAMWISVGAALVFAIIVLALATWLMGRLTSRSDHQSRLVARALDPLPAAVAVLLIAAGAFVAWRTVGPAAFHAGGFGFEYDASFVPSVGGAGQERPPVTQASFGRRGTAAPVTGVPMFRAASLDGARLAVRRVAESLAFDQLDPLPFAGVDNPLAMDISEVTAGGRRALRMRFAYLEPRDDAAGGLPKLRWALVDVVPSAGATYVFSLDAAPETFAAAERAYRDLLMTVQWP